MKKMEKFFMIRIGKRLGWQTMTVERLQGEAKRMGKGWCRVAAAIIVVLLISPRAGWSTVTMNAPLFDAKDLAGGSHSLADLMKDGKTTIVFFWALRCAPCLREMAVLDEIYQARHKDGLEILAIEATGNSAQETEEILDKLKDIMIMPSYPILTDPGLHLSRKFSVQVAPRTFLVNKLGEIVFSFESFSGELKDRLNAGVDALLSGREFPAAAPPPVATTSPAPSVTAPPEPDNTAPSENTNAATAEEEFEKNRYFGDFYFHRGEYDKAIAAYLQGIRFKPDNIYVRLKTGEAYARKKMYAEAREAWEYIIRINPGNAEADANLRRLLRHEY